MRILVDTNVFIDIYLKRDPFYNDSKNAIQMAYSKSDRVFFSSSSVTDIYYNMCRFFHNTEIAFNCIADLVKNVKVATVNERHIKEALISNIKDFEDAVVAVVAKNIEADYILTRNIKDFANSSVKAITPAEFLKLY